MFFCSSLIINNNHYNGYKRQIPAIIYYTNNVYNTIVFAHLRAYILWQNNVISEPITQMSDYSIFLSIIIV